MSGVPSIIGIKALLHGFEGKLGCNSEGVWQTFSIPLYFFHFFQESQIQNFFFFHFLYHMNNFLFIFK
jgi:hypothetical protein